MPTIRLAQPDDSETIVKILRDGLGDKLSNYTIYCSHGMPAFIRAQIKSHDLGGTKYFVSEEDGQIVGFAEFRLLAKEIFLNNIYVTPLGRGSGSGKALLSAGLVLAQERGLIRIGLDVFSDNSKALTWYEKLGFELASESVWLEMEIKADSNKQHFKILNLPFANCLYRNYGFASLEIETSTGEYSVGLLGENFFRVSEAKFFEDKDALACLTTFDSSRKLLYIGNMLHFPTVNPNSYTKVATSFRLSASVVTVLSHMS